MEKNTMRASNHISPMRWEIVREDELGHAMIELEGLYYIVRVDGRSYQFVSALPCDMPSNGGWWCSGWTEGGLKYVASGRSRAAANAQWRKHIVPLSVDDEEV